MHWEDRLTDGWTDNKEQVWQRSRAEPRMYRYSLGNSFNLTVCLKAFMIKCCVKTTKGLSKQHL